MRKNIELKLKNKKTGFIQTVYCHHWAADANAYYCQGVKGHKDPLNIGMAFAKAEWERI